MTDFPLPSFEINSYFAHPKSFALWSFNLVKAPTGSLPYSILPLKPPWTKSWKGS